MQKKTKSASFIYSVIAVEIIIGLWWLLSETVFKRTGVIPSPPDTLLIIGAEMRKPSFASAVFSTLGRSLLSFIISFSFAAVFAVLAHYKKFVKKLLSPFITVCRAMPTMVLVLILLLTVGSKLLPTVVAFLVVFPTCFELMSTAISEVDPKLIDMANVFNVPKIKQVIGIYLPAMLPHIFSAIIAGFGLNIKVVISAEVLGLPSMSIGFLLLNAKQSYNYGASFAWLVIAVILSLICETILRIIRRLCMPYKYDDLAKLKTAFAKIKSIKVKGNNG